MVRIGNEQAYLELGTPQRDGDVVASLVAQGLCASTPIYLHEDHGSVQSLTKFFAHLERHWRGWEGAETWETLEGEFHVRATHSGSHVHLDLEIRNYDLRGGIDWSAQLEVVLDAGEQLTLAATQMREEFGDR